MSYILKKDGKNIKFLKHKTVCFFSLRNGIKVIKDYIMLSWFTNTFFLNVCRCYVLTLYYTDGTWK